MNNYIAGQGYKDGYQDRMTGKTNRSVISLEPDSPYWEEYKVGYSEASRRIIEDARSKVDTRDFLIE